MSEEPKKEECPKKECCKKECCKKECPKEGFFGFPGFHGFGPRCHWKGMGPEMHHHKHKERKCECGEVIPKRKEGEPKIKVCPKCGKDLPKKMHGFGMRCHKMKKWMRFMEMMRMRSMYGPCGFGFGPRHGGLEVHHYIHFGPPPMPGFGFGRPPMFPPFLRRHPMGPPGFGFGRPPMGPPGFGFGRPPMCPPGFGYGRPPMCPPGFGRPPMGPPMGPPGMGPFGHHHHGPHGPHIPCEKKEEPKVEEPKAEEPKKE